jgi:hypothetical protein
MIAAVMVSRSNGKIELFTPDTSPYGLTYGQWTTKWWQWLISIPMRFNPAADESGRNASLNQTDPNVWFLAGTLGGKAVNRKCTIPVGRAILFPVINIEVNALEKPELRTDAELMRYVMKDEDDILNLDALVDGEKVPIYRVRSDPSMFPLKIPSDNPFEVPGGRTTLATSDGYWVFLRPLCPGQHGLFFAASCSLGTRNVKATYNLTIT